jgi:hypothetical protein
MPKMRMLLAALTVATGSVLGALAAYAVPSGIGTMPEAGGTASAIIPVHGMMMNGLECIWYLGCKYCRANPQSQWMLQFCKKHHG